jgi:Co/Zn/Cd efflux system component
MSDHQIQGLLLLAVGLVALIASVGTAWALARYSRTGRVGSAGFITALSFALFVVGVVLCGYGVTLLLGG